jgi:hypothetical protein
MEGWRAGQKDGKKVGVVEGWEEGGWGRWMGRRWAWYRDGRKEGGQKVVKKVGVVVVDLCNRFIAVKKCI